MAGLNTTIFSNPVFMTVSILVNKLDNSFVVHLCISQFQAPTSPNPPPRRNFFKVVKFSAPGQKIFSKLRPQGKIIDKNHAPGDNFVDLQDNFAMIVKPFALFWCSSLVWLSSSFFKDYKACEYKISQ